MAAIIQVIAGLIFVFLLLSILVTEVNSLIAKASKLRAKHLRQSLNQIIEDPVIQAKVYTHPLIQLVKAAPVAPGQRISRAEATAIAGSSIGNVDWLEPATFVDVVLNTIKAESDQQLFGAFFNVIDGMPAGPERRGLRVMLNRVVSSGQGMKELRRAIPYVRDHRHRNALTDIMNQIDEEISLLGAQPGTNVALMAGIRQIDSPNLRGALATVMSNAENMDAARGNLETWFNNTMQRASAQYATKMKRLSVVVALVIALGLNVDALNIAQALWDDPARREQLSSELNLSVQSGALQTQLDDVSAGGAEYSANLAEADSGIEGAIDSGAAIAYQLQDLQDLSLPIGWTINNVEDLPQAHFARADRNNLWNLLPDNNPDGWLGLLALKALGIAATVIAAAQGAPFWFGIVNRILRR